MYNAIETIWVLHSQKAANDQWADNDLLKTVLFTLPTLTFPKVVALIKIFKTTNNLWAGMTN